MRVKSLNPAPVQSTRLIFWRDALPFCLTNQVSTRMAEVCLW